MDIHSALIGGAIILGVEFILAILFLYLATKNAPTMKSEDEVILEHYSASLEQQKAINLALQKENTYLRKELKELSNDIFLAEKEIKELKSELSRQK